MPDTSLEKDKIRFLLLEGVDPTALDNLKANGYTNVEYLKSALPDDELKERIKDVHFIGIRSRTQLTREVFDAANKLIGVGCFCIGTNQVDLDAALERGIPVFNAPYSNTRSVAELVVAEAVMLMRGIPWRNAASHRGEWTKSTGTSHEVRGKKLGIVGYGNIGAQVSVLAEAMGMQVYFYDIVQKLPMGNAQQVEDLHELLGMCDVITLHVPDTAQTRGMYTEKEIRAQKPGSYLINYARGKVVDLDALARALDDKHLLGAAIDVFPVEPKGQGEAFENVLRGYDNVILTPHIGGATNEAQANIGSAVTGKLIQYSDTGSTVGAVNFPQVQLPAHPDTHRVLNIHQNVPGVLSKINTMLSENNVNVTGQFLQTNNSVGYVVIDMDPENSHLVREKLAEIPESIRTRLLF